MAAESDAYLLMEDVVKPQPAQIAMNDDSNENVQSFRDYGARWFMLALFCLATIANAVAWITFSPISKNSALVYDVDETYINLLSLIYMIAYVPVVFPANYVTDTLGLRISLLLGSILTAIGAWVRYAGQPGESYSYGVVFLGQALAGIGQPFLLAAPPKVASNWFKPQQRTIATTIASVANPLGVALGFVLPTIFVPDSSNLRSDIGSLLLAEAILCVVAAVLVVFAFKDKPPTPPCETATQQRDEFWPAMKHLFSNRHFLFLFLEFSMGLGSFNTLATLISTLIAPFGFGDSDSSLLGALVIVAGLVGSGVAGFVVDKTHRYRHTLMICFIGSSLAALAFAFLLHTQQIALVAISAALLGLFMTPVMPLSLELACEVTYPVGEATSAGFLLTGGQIVGVVEILVMDKLTQAGYVDVANGITVGGILIGLVFMHFFHGKLKRLQTDHVKDLDKCDE
eukprot:GILK01005006.1.p1 GENE.GILK01005006.1~~GILK01005006.1.p1  ORF type:complete len:457 (-),score=72.14 GILK01005006.1:248-1618(-)